MKNPVFKWLSQKKISYHKKLSILSFLQIILGLTAIFFAFYSKQTIDEALQSTSTSTFIFYASLLGALLLIQLVVSSITPYVRTHYQVQIENHMRSSLYEKLLYASLREVESYHSGDLLNHLTSDVKQVSDGVTDLLPRFLFYAVRLIGASILLFLIDPFLSLIIIGSGVMLYLGSRLLSSAIKRRHKSFQEAETKAKAMIQESLTQLSVIKSFEAEEKMTNHLDKLHEIYLHAALKKQQLTVLSSLGLTGFLALGYGLSIILGALRLADGAITVGGLLALVQLVGHLQSPFSGISQLVPKYYHMLASFERLAIIDGLPLDEKSDTVMSSFESIEADHLSFAYHEHLVINDLSFTIKPHQFIHIKGPSGQGKTTLFKLLLGLYQPTHGHLSIIDQQQKFPIQASTRHLFTYVPQGNMMMSGTIKDNLMLYQTSSEERLWEVIDIVGLSEDLHKFPLKLETLLGEKGSGLSEGQIQRLAIARALLKDSPILLLDEITSALDLDNELKLMNNLKKLVDKTIIFISHKELPPSLIDEVITL